MGPTLLSASEAGRGGRRPRLPRFPAHSRPLSPCVTPRRRAGGRDSMRSGCSMGSRPPCAAAGDGGPSPSLRPLPPRKQLLPLFHFLPSQVSLPPSSPGVSAWPCCLLFEGETDRPERVCTRAAQACIFAQSCPTPRTVARQDLLSMGFSRQEYWSGLPFPSPGDLPDPGMEPRCPASSALAGGFFTTMLKHAPVCKNPTATFRSISQVLGCARHRLENHFLL